MESFGVLLTQNITVLQLNSSHGRLTLRHFPFCFRHPTGRRRRERTREPPGATGERSAAVLPTDADEKPQRKQQLRDARIPESGQHLTKVSPGGSLQSRSLGTRQEGPSGDAAGGTLHAKAPSAEQRRSVLRSGRRRRATLRRLRSSATMGAQRRAGRRSRRRKMGMRSAERRERVEPED